MGDVYWKGQLLGEGEALQIIIKLQAENAALKKEINDLKERNKELLNDVVKINQVIEGKLREQPNAK